MERFDDIESMALSNRMADLTRYVDPVFGAVLYQSAFWNGSRPKFSWFVLDFYFMHTDCT